MSSQIQPSSFTFPYISVISSSHPPRQHPSRHPLCSHRAPCSLLFTTSTFSQTIFRRRREQLKGEEEDGAEDGKEAGEMVSSRAQCKSLKITSVLTPPRISMLSSECKRGK